MNVESLADIGRFKHHYRGGHSRRSLEDYDDAGGGVEPSRRSSGRVRVAIIKGHSVRGQARVASVDDLEGIFALLGEYGPEPEGIVLEVDEEALAILPDAWEVEEVGQCSD